MNKSLILKNKLYVLFLLVISLFIFFYLFYFLINGERGIISYYKIKNINQKYKENLEILANKNSIMIDRIERLQTGTLDLDFVDEKIRERTGLLYKDELLIKF